MSCLHSIRTRLFLTCTRLDAMTVLGNCLLPFLPVSHFLYFLQQQNYITSVSQNNVLFVCRWSVAFKKIHAIFSFRCFLCCLLIRGVSIWGGRWRWWHIYKWSDGHVTIQWFYWACVQCRAFSVFPQTVSYGSNWENSFFLLLLIRWRR